MPHILYWLQEYCDSIYLFFFNIYDVNTYKKTELILMYNMLDQRLLNDSLKENLA